MGDGLDRAYDQVQHNQSPLDGMIGGSSMYSQEIYNNDPTWKKLKSDLNKTFNRIIKENAPKSEKQPMAQKDIPVQNVGFEQALKELLGGS